MASHIPNSSRRDSRSFQTVVDAFLAGDGLPFANIFSAERIQRIFVKHGCRFGLHGVYTTAIMVWSFLGQVHHLIVWTRPQRPTWTDEAAYAKIPEQLVLREIRYNIVERGRRTRTIDVITTLVDAKEHS